MNRFSSIRKNHAEAKRTGAKLARSWKKDFAMVSITSISVGFIIIYINFLLFSDRTQLFAVINLIGALVIVMPPIMFRYTQYSKIKKVEEVFPRFLSDVTSNIKSGMTLTQAIRALRSYNYGLLTPYVNEINAKISWGVPFDQVLVEFAEKIGSKNMRRTVQSIIEAHRSGGTMDTVMEAVSESLYELEKIKKERSASVYSQLTNGYMIFFVFVGVMIGMSRFLLPSFSFETSAVEGGADFQQILPSIFSNIVIIQGIFAGLSIGKMSEGTLIAGLKHSAVLAIIGYTIILVVG